MESPQELAAQRSRSSTPAGSSRSESPAPLAAHDSRWASGRQPPSLESSWQMPHGGIGAPQPSGLDALVAQGSPSYEANYPDGKSKRSGQGEDPYSSGQWQG